MTNPDMQQTLIDIASRYQHQPYSVLQMLRQVQNTYSYVPEEAIHFYSERLKLPLSQLRGCVEFYSFLHTQPRGMFDVYFSDSITDHMLDSRQLAFRLANLLGVVPGTPRADGRVTVDFTSCTGLCDQGPAALVNGRPLTNLTPARITKMAGLIEAGVDVSAWPAEWFKVHDTLFRPGVIFSTLLKPGAAIRKTMDKGAEAILQELDLSNLRGRGGAGFKTAQKWRFCRETQDDKRYVVCNADEGEPGTFKDRVLLTRMADLLFEGMTLAAYIVGSQQGFLYLRSEYQYLLPRLEGLLQMRRDAGLLGRHIMGTDFDFDIAIHFGAGAYICGEESALIESLEGKRGQARVRPPFPVVRGYDQHPTIVNNVQTFIQAAQITQKGGAWFAQQGTEHSRGTVLLSISGDVEKRGIYEYEFGVTIAQVLLDCDAKHVQAVQIGGPSGHTIAPHDFKRRIAFEDVATTGSFMVFGQHRDMVAMAQNFAQFFQHESCGFCTPCRVGTTLLRQLLDKVMAGKATAADLDEIAEISDVTQHMSHCGLGQTAPNALLDTLKQFRRSYEIKLVSGNGNPGFDLDAELSQSRQITGRDDAVAHGRSNHHE